ncbi:MAG: ATP-binding protein [Chloroflexota bacterium]|nr:ATP-binding protein [Chloroflexota bacterium]MDE2897881.1 ATP-binding protein [Chloroflexota bacterium]
MAIPRDLAPRLLRAAQIAPSITLTGPRQSGKTTLARAVFPEHSYVSLEAPDTRAFAAEDPRRFLAEHPNGAIIDEVQRVPDLPAYLQEVIDSDPRPGRWILTGSQNLALAASVSQSLAGRTSVHYLLPLARREVVRFDEHPRTLEDALFAGGYPRIFDRRADPSEWLRSYVATYVERDVRTISQVGDLATFQRFVELCAGRTGQLVNFLSLASDCGVSQPTAKAWLSILEASFIAFRLPPFHGNVGKRLVKTPKLHFYDTGLACWLIGIRAPQQLRTHPLRGAIFETWVVSEIFKHRLIRGETRGLGFYRNREGAEVDLVIKGPSGMTLVEAKSSQTPSESLFGGALRVQRQLADASLSCDVAVIYGGGESQDRAAGRVIPWDSVHQAAEQRLSDFGPADAATRASRQTRTEGQLRGTYL